MRDAGTITDLGEALRPGGHIFDVEYSAATDFVVCTTDVDLAAIYNGVLKDTFPIDTAESSVIDGDYVFTASSVQDGGLVVTYLDATGFTAVAVLNCGGNGARDVVVDPAAARAYVLHSKSYSTVDVSEPEAPKYLGTQSLGGPSSKAFALDGDFLIVATGDGPLLTFDVAALPSAPPVQGPTPADEVTGLAVALPYVYAATAAGIIRYTYDSATQQLTELGTTPVQGTPLEMKVERGYIHVGAEGGYFIFGEGLVVPTTPAPETLIPPTPAPAAETEAPPTATPATPAPPSPVPTTVPQPTVAPSTLVPATVAPSTLVPATVAPPTLVPATVAPPVPPTTEVPTSPPLPSITASPAAVPSPTRQPTAAPPPPVRTPLPETLAPPTRTPRTWAPQSISPPTAAPTATDAPPTGTSVPLPLRATPAPPVAVWTAVPLPSGAPAARTPTPPPARGSAAPATSAPATKTPFAWPVRSRTGVPAAGTAVPASEAPSGYGVSEAPASGVGGGTAGGPGAWTASPYRSVVRIATAKPDALATAPQGAGIVGDMVTGESASAAGVIIGAAVFSGAGAGAAGTLVAARLGCALTLDGTSMDMPLLLHPTRWRPGGNEAFGVILGNLGLCLFLAVVMYGLCLLLSGFDIAEMFPKYTGSPDMMGILRFPSVPLFVHMFLLPGTSLGASLLLHMRTSAAAVGAGLLAMLLCSAMPMGIYRHFSSSVPEDAIYYVDTRPVGTRWLVHWIGPGEWTSTRRPYHWSYRFVGSINSFHEGYAWYSAVDMMFVVLASLVLGMRPEEYVFCGHARVALACVFLAQLACECKFWPHAKTRDNVMDCAMLALMAVSMLLMAVGYYNNDNEHAVMGWAATCLNIAMILLLVKAALDVTGELYVLVSGRRTRLQDEVWGIGALDAPDSASELGAMLDHGQGGPALSATTLDLAGTKQLALPTSAALGTDLDGSAALVDDAGGARGVANGRATTRLPRVRASTFVCNTSSNGLLAVASRKDRNRLTVDDALAFDFRSESSATTLQRRCSTGSDVLSPRGTPMSHASRGTPRAPSRGDDHSGASLIAAATGVRVRPLNDLELSLSNANARSKGSAMATTRVGTPTRTAVSPVGNLRGIGGSQRSRCGPGRGRMGGTPGGDRSLQALASSGTLRTMSGSATPPRQRVASSSPTGSTLRLEGGANGEGHADAERERDMEELKEKGNGTIKETQANDAGPTQDVEKPSGTGGSGSGATHVPMLSMPPDTGDVLSHSQRGPESAGLSKSHSQLGFPHVSSVTSAGHLKSPLLPGGGTIVSFLPRRRTASSKKVFLRAPSHPTMAHASASDSAVSSASGGEASESSLTRRNI